MKGIEFLRKLYSGAGLTIKLQAPNSKVDLLKQMARTVGASPSEIREALESLAEPHRTYVTPQERENVEVRALTSLFVDKIRDHLKGSSVVPESPEIRV